VKGILYYTDSVETPNLTEIKPSAILYLDGKLKPQGINLKTDTVTIFSSENEITGQNLDYVNQSGFTIYLVPFLLAFVFIGTVLYFAHEKKHKIASYHHSIDEERDGSTYNDLEREKEYRASDQMNVSSPMLVTKTKLVSPRMNGSGIKQKKDNLAYKPLECADPSYNMFPLADIDTNSGDFILRKRTPTKVSTDYMFPDEHDDSTVTTIEFNDITFAMTESSKKTRSASKRNGYPYHKSGGMSGKDKLLHEWNLEYNGRRFEDTMEL
jgi:hypothetical protein